MSDHDIKFGSDFFFINNFCLFREQVAPKPFDMHELKTVLFGYLCLMLCQDLHLLTPGTSLAQAYDFNKYHVSRKQLTWVEAELYCNKQNMKLAETLTYEELNSLRAFIRGERFLPGNSEAGYWLGAKLKNNEWIWVPSNYKLKDHFTPGWHFGQPAKIDPKVFRPECMELQYRTGSDFVRSLSWNDQWCDEKRGAVCETWITVRQAGSK